MGGGRDRRRLCERVRVAGRRSRPGLGGTIVIASLRRGSVLCFVDASIGVLGVGTCHVLGAVDDVSEILNGVVRAVFLGQIAFEEREIVGGDSIVVCEELIGMGLLGSDVVGVLLGIEGVRVLVVERKKGFRRARARRRDGGLLRLV